MTVKELIAHPIFRMLTWQGLPLARIHRDTGFSDLCGESTARRAWHVLRSEFAKYSEEYRNANDPPDYVAPDAAGVPDADVPDAVFLDNEINAARDAYNRRDAARALRSAIDRIARLEEEQEVFGVLSERVRLHEIGPESAREERSHCAIPVVLFSDWHVDEIVEASSVGGLNEYSPEIAKLRADNTARRTVKLIEKEQKAVAINEAIIWLGGDFITGYIHEENLIRTAMGPTEAIVYAASLLGSALRYIADGAKLSKITLPCSLGNHGRTTKRMFMQGSGTNHEAAMYRFLAKEFEGDSRFNFIHPISDFVYLDVFNETMRFHHGHYVKFLGGENGLGVPLSKKVRKWNQSVPAGMTIIGHYHTHSMPTNDSWTNGSLIGFNAYAQSIGAPCEPPVQGFRLLDNQYGWTISAPIFADKK